jgi:hypothetical protein
MPKVKQHYIPQSIMRRFKDQNFGLCIFDLRKNLLLKNQNSKNHCYMRNMYNLDKEEISLVLRDYIEFFPSTSEKLNFNDKELVENYFMRIEYNLSILFNRILKSDVMILSQTDKFLITTYLHDLAHRTKYIRDTLGEINEKDQQIIEEIEKANGMSPDQIRVSKKDVGRIPQLQLTFSFKSLVRV